MLSKIVEDTAVELIRISATELPVEYVREMDRLMRKTKGATGKAQLKSILDNVSIARKNSWPMCQDTGVVAFMVRVGDKFPIRSELEGILTKATKRATNEIPIRPNAVDMLKGNTNDNTGAHVPIIYWELVPGNELEIIAMPK
jgi:fumarate hydratase subunit alpha